MASPKAAETYTRSEVRRILKITENRLRSWERLDLCERRTDFGFADLIALKTLQKLREKRIPATRIKSSLASLGKKLAGIKRPLWDLKIVSDGKRVAVELPGGKMEALTGQMLFDFDASSLRPVTELSNREGRTADRVREAEDWFRRGLQLEEGGSAVQEAVDAYRKALELNPDAAGAWVNIGTLLYQQRELEEAERCYREALKDVSGLRFSTLQSRKHLRGERAPVGSRQPLPASAEPAAEIRRRSLQHRPSLRTRGRTHEGGEALAFLSQNRFHQPLGTDRSSAAQRHRGSHARWPAV